MINHGYNPKKAVCDHFTPNLISAIRPCVFSNAVFSGLDHSEEEVVVVVLDFMKQLHLAESFGTDFKDFRKKQFSSLLKTGDCCKGIIHFFLI